MVNMSGRATQRNRPTPMVAVFVCGCGCGCLLICVAGWGLASRSEPVMSERAEVLVEVDGKWTFGECRIRTVLIDE